MAPLVGGLRGPKRECPGRFGPGAQGPIGVGVRSMENKNFLPHANKQAKIYLLDCSNESIEY